MLEEAQQLGTVTSITEARRRRSMPPRTAFVLSGGASLGALQAGMLRALYELGVAPDFLVATSAGAINASFVCSRPQTVATARGLARIWRGLQREQVFPVSPWVMARGLLGRRDHLVPAGSLRELLSEHLEMSDLAEAAIPLHIVAFDLEAGCEVLLSSGSALDAVCGSAAIPGVFPPVELDHRRLIDGGVVNNTPISHAVALGAERIYVLPTMDPSDTPVATKRGALASAINGLGLLQRSRLEADVAIYSRQVELVVLPAPNRHNVLPTDFGKADLLMRDGLNAARARLARDPAMTRTA